VNALQVGAVVGLLFGAGVLCVVHGLRRTPTLAAARRQMFGPSAVSRSSSNPQQRSVAVGHWTQSVADRAAGRWLTDRFGPGLQIVELTASDVVTRIVVAAGSAAFGATALAVVFTTGGLLPMTPLWVPFIIAVTTLAGWVMLHDVASRIARRRRELRQAANDFVQLVSVGLTTDQSVEEAIRFALRVGASDAFDTLRRQISTAPQRGVAVWEALDDFGRTHGIDEMSEFAASIERQGLQGVSIGQTVASLAQVMRAKALDELERAADRANANLSGPTIGFVVTTIVFLAFPLALRISDAFGG